MLMRSIGLVILSAAEATSRADLTWRLENPSKLIGAVDEADRVWISVDRAGRALTVKFIEPDAAQ
jgi:hypothetical protein